MATHDHVACREALHGVLRRYARVIDVSDLMRDMGAWKTSAVFEAIDRLVVEGYLQPIGPKRRPVRVVKGGRHV